MLFFKLTNGPEVLVDDGCDEMHALYAIGHWLHGWLLDDPAGVRQQILRIHVMNFRVLLMFQDGVNLECAKRIGKEAWQMVLSDYFQTEEIAVMVGLRGVPCDPLTPIEAAAVGNA